MSGSSLLTMAVSLVTVVVLIGGSIWMKCLSNKLITRCLFISTFLLVYTSSSMSVTAANSAAAAVISSYNSPIQHECGSIDVRNDCSNLLQLQNCTVINGYLMIVLLRKIDSSSPDDQCDYSQYKFPLLREITDFLIFYDVRGLRRIVDLFPNLTVIRGRQLFLNYALGVTSMPDLETLEFKSLVAIQRGHVFVGSCPKLCKLEKINWDRLTLSPGENHIYPMTTNDDRCQIQPNCIGCVYCWTDAVCQKFENDNVVNLLQGSHHCHEECLGGCTNTTAEGCVVCRHLTDHGSCVRQCPEDKYFLEHYQRCYTADECVNKLRLYTYGFDCVFDCPSGYTPDEHFNCVRCSGGDSCIKRCHISEAVTIYNLADADHIKGCHSLNGSLLITIRNRINEMDLFRSFGSLQEITGHLKISRSPYLTSLKFLQNLRKISGEPLENDRYGLIVYGNSNLTELWSPTKDFEIVRGGMYIQMNNKICNRHLKDFLKNVKHDSSLNAVQQSDQEVMCGAAKLMLDIEVLSHHSLRFVWRKDQTSDKIEIILKPLPSKSDVLLEERSELDSDVCSRINWQRKLLFPSELHYNNNNNGTHYSYEVDGLTQNTKYACLVKTFGVDYSKDARSELLYAITMADIPSPPRVEITKKTDSSLTVRVQPANHPKAAEEVVSYYMVDLFDLPDDVRLIDKRNYCNQPSFLMQDMPLEAYESSNHNEDYDDCCTRQEEAIEDRQFIANIQEMYGCRQQKAENCLNDQPLTEPEYSQTDRLYRIKLEQNDTSHTFHGLQRFHSYVLQVQACNDRGCGSYAMHSERTNYSSSGDKPDDLSACRQPGEANIYRVHFSEPKHPNGVIVSYVIHYRVYVPSRDEYQSHINCVTRRQHELAHFEYVAHFNVSYTHVAVRVHSLAGDILSDWVTISSCDEGGHYEPAVVGLPAAKLAGVVSTGKSGRSSRGLSVFLVFFLIGAAGTAVWICYKRRYWRKIPELCRYIPFHLSWRNLLSLRRDTASSEDRQILVDEFETVRFHNNSDDELKFLE